MSIDSIGNFLTIIRNGTKVARPFVYAPYSKIRHAIVQILIDEGFVKGVEVTQDSNNKDQLKIALKYVGGESVIHELRRVSKCSRRLYAGAQGVAPVIGGLGVSILTTDKGVVTHKKAKQLGVGGEIICTVW